MSKKKRKANKIETEENYLSFFPEDKPTETEKMRSRTLKEAQEIRKFEIDLYWKRTGFFWAFITVIYTALFAVLCKYVDCSCTDTPCKYSFFVPVISALSGLGFFFSVAWHMVNKGSKFWQKNWETHVSLLEKSEIGPLYDVYLNPKTTGSRWKPTKEFDFSVTKVNMWASFMMMFCSLATGIGCIKWLIFDRKESIAFIVIPFGIIFIFTIFMIFFSHGNDDIEIIDEQSISAEENINLIKLV